jgi:hypothetical protein
MGRSMESARGRVMGKQLNHEKNMTIPTKTDQPPSRRPGTFCYGL